MQEQRHNHSEARTFSSQEVFQSQVDIRHPGPTHSGALETPIFEIALDVQRLFGSSGWECE